MQNISLKPTVAVGMLGLLLSLCLCNGWLLFHSLKQTEAIAKINTARTAQTASAGEHIPSIEGVSLADGTSAKFTAKSSNKTALLVFREGCHFCAANWKNWDALFGPSGLGTDVVFVTSDKKLSKSYLDSHPLLQQKKVLLGVSEATLDSLRLGATPQTICIQNDTIKQDWTGVLSEEDIKKIRLTLSQS